jgi:hypothetical protein
VTRLARIDSADRWEDFLDPGEKLLWQGAPAPGLRITLPMVGLSLFGLPFLAAGLGTFGFGLVQLLGGRSLAEGGTGLFLIAFSAPFAGVGGLMVFGTWYKAAHRRVRYALSTRRAYVATSWWKRRLESYPISPDTPLELERGPTDSIWFRTETRPNSDTTTRVGFENITEGERVYALLRRIQRGEA